MLTIYRSKSELWTHMIQNFDWIKVHKIWVGILQCKNFASGYVPTYRDCLEMNAFLRQLLDNIDTGSSSII